MEQRRADPAWVEAKNKQDREYSIRSYQDNPEVKRRGRFRDWVFIE